MQEVVAHDLALAHSLTLHLVTSHPLAQRRNATVCEPLRVGNFGGPLRIRKRKVARGVSMRSIYGMDHYNVASSQHAVHVDTSTT